MFVLATMHGATISGPIKIRNLSQGGALIEGAALPAIGEQVDLRRGQVSVSGKVVWCQGGRAGLQFDGRAIVAEWLPGGHTGQQQVDQTFQQLKSKAGTSLSSTQPSALKPTTPTALELKNLADAVCSLADDLAEDAAVVARHSSKLQVLDMAVQALRRYATM